MFSCFFQKLPSQAVNIRAIETVRYSVIDQKKEQVLEEIEESKAFFQVLTSTYVDKELCYLSKFIKFIYAVLDSGIRWCSVPASGENVFG